MENSSEHGSILISPQEGSSGSQFPAGMRWNRESVLEALRAVDTRRLAEGNMRPLTDSAIALYSSESPDIPSRRAVAEHVGTMDDLQKELGRVTTKIALEWTDEQWTDNALWARDVLKAERIKTVTKRHIARLASAGLMPNLHAIKTKWGSLDDYRVQTSLAKRRKLIIKDKDKLIDNGRKYAGYLGEKIGFPLMPRRRDIQAGAKKGRTPGLSQIVAISGSVPEYQEDLGFVTPYVVRKWTDQQWRDNFLWLRDVWTEHGREVTSLVDLLDIAGKLHIGPSVSEAERHWGNLTNYGKHAGHESEIAKRNLSNEGVLRAAMELVVKRKTPLQKSNIGESSDLGETMIDNRFGGIAKLNFRLGMMTQGLEWDRNMLLWWGVTSFMQREKRLPGVEDLRTWRDNNRGPPVATVQKEFDSSLGTYYEALERAHTWLKDQVYLLSRAHKGDLRLRLLFKVHEDEMPRIPEAILRQAINHDPELFHPEKNIVPQELEIFYRLKDAGGDMRFIAMVMQQGVPFAEPGRALIGLANTLANCNMLNSATLRRLESYVIGLAPPEAGMSWTGFVADYQQKHQSNFS